MGKRRAGGSSCGCISQSVRMVQRFSLRRQYSKVSLKHTSLSVCSRLHAADPFRTSVFAAGKVFYHLYNANLVLLHIVFHLSTLSHCLWYYESLWLWLL